MFKYSWIWVKNRPSDKFNAKNKPMDCYEDINVFSLGTIANGSLNKMNYYPQELIRSGKTVRGTTGKRHHGTRPSHKEKYILEWTNYPNNVLYFPKDDTETVHPTQKPVDLFRYLIRTYTQPNELVFDPCVGSGTTAIAAREEGRSFIVGDSSLEYCAVARNRLAQPWTPSFMPMLESVETLLDA
jgi:site-specific DNA-methyltransferase (adenine-specific)